MKLTCYGTYTDGKEFWLPSKEMNALYYMNSSDKSIKYKDLFSGCLNDNAWKIKKIIEYKNELFFFSMHAYQVWRLNRVTNEIEEYVYCIYPVSQITNVEVVRNEVWVIPNSFNSPIVIFDLEKKKGRLFPWDSEPYLNYGSDSFIRAARSGDKLYFATRNKDDIHLCILDCKQKTILFENLNTLSLIQCIETDGDKLWVFGEDKQKKNVLQEYDINTLKKRMSYDLVLPEKLMEKGGLSYFLMMVLGNSILLLPAWAKEIVLFDLEMKMEKVIKYPEKFRLALEKVKGYAFYEIQKTDKKIYFMPHLIPQILILDTETMTFEMQKVGISAEECKKAFDYCFCSAERMKIYEINGLLVNDFCEMLKGADSYAGDFVQDNVGMTIYRSLSNRGGG